MLSRFSFSARPQTATLLPDTAARDRSRRLLMESLPGSVTWSPQALSQFPYAYKPEMPIKYNCIGGNLPEPNFPLT